MVCSRRRVPFGDLPEVGSECEMLVRREVLLGEEDDFVVEESLTDVRHRGGWQRLTQADAADLGARGAGERGNCKIDMRIDGRHVRALLGRLAQLLIVD
jgi:hypothetical protein